MCAMLSVIVPQELRISRRRISCFLDAYIGASPVFSTCFSHSPHSPLRYPNKAASIHVCSLSTQVLPGGGHPELYTGTYIILLWTSCRVFTIFLGGNNSLHLLRAMSEAFFRTFRLQVPSINTRRHLLILFDMQDFFGHMCHLVCIHFCADLYHKLTLRLAVCLFAVCCSNAQSARMGDINCAIAVTTCSDPWSISQDPSCLLLINAVAR